MITHKLVPVCPCTRRKRGGSLTAPGKEFLSARPLQLPRDPLFQIGNLNPDRKGLKTICPTRPDRALWEAEHKARGTQWMWARCRLAGPPPRFGIGAGEPGNPSTRVPNRSPGATYSTQAGTKAMDASADYPRARGSHPYDILSIGRKMKGFLSQVWFNFTIRRPAWANVRGMPGYRMHWHRASQCMSCSFSWLWSRSTRGH